MAEVMQDKAQHVSDQSGRYARDLLRRFAGGSVSDSSQPVARVEGPRDVELSLGLSLGGLFGVDPKDKGLVRSSSVASFPFSTEQEPVVASAAHGLARTCSLPVATEEELLRKRREMQCLRRMEAKRKRLEKKGLGPRSTPRAEEIRAKVVDRGCGGTVLPSSGKDGVNAAEADLRGSRSLPDGVWFEEQKGYTPPLPHRPNNSRCQPEPMSTPRVDKSSLPVGKERAAVVESMSSGVTDFDFQQIQGIICNLKISASVADEDSTASSRSIPLLNHTSSAIQISPLVSTTASTCHESTDDAHCKTTVEGNRLQEPLKSMMEQMPCVSTKGVGPSGQKIDGFLYKYGNGEEVRIVCACHGSFLTPAEFVKHAGGGDVSHPLRHIVVNPLPADSL